MNFFKKIFSSKENQTTNKTASIDIKFNTEIKPIASNNNNIEFYSISKISGIDYEFIDLIYFPNNTDKETYINNIILVLSNLKINFGSEFQKVYDRIINYNSTQVIPFLIESLLVEEFNVKKDINGIVESKSKEVIKGANKINDYYSATSFICENLRIKLKYKYFDYTFEEKLFDKYVIDSSINNYSKLNTLYCLGNAYFKNSDFEKAEHYYGQIEKIKFELETSTVSNYFRNIGEDYAGIKDNFNALKWLKAGLLLNSKLGVKKLILKLENEIKSNT